MSYLASEIRLFKNNIRFAYQRAVRGYDDRIVRGYGLDGYLEVLIEPIREFCVNELEESTINLRRTDVFKKTVSLIDAYKKEEDMIKLDNALDILWKYIGAHIGYYWN